MRALVTGAAGFLGRHFTHALQARGYTVARADTRLGLDANQIFAGRLYVDARFDLVVHAAAVAPHRAAIDTQPASHLRNQALDAALFDWAAATGQGRVLYVSSCAALEREPDDYGLLKLTGERMARQARAAGLPVTVVRPYSGYGEDQGEDWPFGAFAARARRREDPFTIWGDGSQVRDWIHISDVVDGALAVANSGTEEPVSLCTGIGTSMFDLARMMLYATGGHLNFLFDSDRPAGVPYRVGDPTVMNRWHTAKVSIEDGVRRALCVSPSS